MFHGQESKLHLTKHASCRCSFYVCTSNFICKFMVKLWKMADTALNGVRKINIVSSKLTKNLATLNACIYK